MNSFALIMSVYTFCSQAELFDFPSLAKKLKTVHGLESGSSSVSLMSSSSSPDILISNLTTMTNTSASGGSREPPSPDIY